MMQSSITKLHKSTKMALLMSISTGWLLPFANGNLFAQAIEAKKTASASSAEISDEDKKISASVRAYMGGLIEYYDEKESGAYRGASFSAGYDLSDRVNLGASISYSQSLGADSLHENYASFNDLGLSVGLPRLFVFGRRDYAISTSVSGSLPTSKYSQEHESFGSLSNGWSLSIPTELVLLTPSISYSKNFYRYDQQRTVVRAGDAIGRSHIDQSMSFALGIGKSFDMGIGINASYGVTRVIPHIGRVLTRNNSSLSLSYKVAQLKPLNVVPYASIRTAASQLDYNDEMYNYALYEKNRTSGEMGVTVGF